VQGLLVALVMCALCVSIYLVAGITQQLTTSTPGDSRASMGVPGDESWKLRSRSYGWLTTYLGLVDG